MNAPSPESIREGVEKLTSFVDWLVDVLRGNNPVKKLLLLDFLLFAIFNPYFPDLINLIGKRPDRYGWVFWPTIGLVFIAAVITALLIKKKHVPDYEVDERSPIKGLFPFGYADAKLFRHLQRENNIRECLVALVDTQPQFRLSILCGESGCGKTSFLQAGLWPKLSEQGHRCLYVRFRDIDPLDSIRLAIIQQFKLSRELVDNADLCKLLDAVTESGSEPVILLFDQFEQFFVHHKRQEQRESFVQALAAWYQHLRPLPVRILICLRDDFVGRLVELQTAMGYSLGPQQNLRLKNFKPQEAVEIFRVIAELAGVTFNESFVNEFTQQELASEDGLISPVDIQILALMINAEKTEEERAFNRATFQKLGGIEGLLERFLKWSLEKRETESRKEAAIHVLLALTDLDGNAGAGELTLDALRKKLPRTVSDVDTDDALEWLAGIRLIKSADDVYELAHERLIPALRRVAKEKLPGIDEASKLLHQRVNEWLGNGRASRYLLSWREWRLIEQQRRSLVWEPKKIDKETLLLQTRRRWRIRLTAVISLLLIVSSSSIVRIVWLRSEAGQIHQTKRDLLRLSEGIDDSVLLLRVVKSFVVSGNLDEALVVARGMTNSGVKAIALSVIADAIRGIDSQQSERLFEESITVAERIKAPNEQSSALNQLAVVIGKSDPQRSTQLLLEALQLRKKDDSPFIQVMDFHAIARAIAIIRPQQSNELLRKIIESADDINDLPTQAHILSTLAGALAQTDPKLAIELLKRAVGIMEGGGFHPYAGSEVWRALCEGISKVEARESMELFNQTITMVGEIHPPRLQAIVLSDIAEFLAKIDTERSREVFKQAIETARAHPVTPTDPFELYPDLLRYIAIGIGEAAEDELSTEFSNQASEIAGEIENPFSKAITLSKVAGLIAKIDPERSKRLLEDAIETVERIDNYRGKASARSAIAAAKARLAVAKQSAELLSQALKIAMGIDDADSHIPPTGAEQYHSYKGGALRSISRAAAELKYLRLGREVALLSRDNRERATSLSVVLRTWAGPKASALADEHQDEEYWRNDVRGLR